MKKHKPAYYGSQQLKDKPAWKVFSRYIRQRDGRCISCGIQKPWQELDAGHFLAGNICGKGLFFSERNVFAQCTGCNRFKHGNGSEYSIAITRLYPNILEELDQIRREEKQKGIICRFSREELKEIEETYKKKLAEL